MTTNQKLVDKFLQTMKLTAANEVNNSGLDHSQTGTVVQYDQIQTKPYYVQMGDSIVQARSSGPQYYVQDVVYMTQYGGTEEYVISGLKSRVEGIITNTTIMQDYDFLSGNLWSASGLDLKTLKVLTTSMPKTEDNEEFIGGNTLLMTFNLNGNISGVTKPLVTVAIDGRANTFTIDDVQGVLTNVNNEQQRFIVSLDKTPTTVQIELLSGVQITNFKAFIAREAYKEKTNSLVIAPTDKYKFTVDDTATSTITLTAQLRKNGLVEELSDASCYWFIEDPLVNSVEHKNYSIYGGKGWRALNEVNEATEELQPESASLVVSFNEVQRPAVGFKCIATDANGIRETSNIFKIINEAVPHLEVEYDPAQQVINTTLKVGEKEIDSADYSGYSFSISGTDAYKEKLDDEEDLPVFIAASHSFKVDETKIGIFNTYTIEVQKNNNLVDKQSIKVERQGLFGGNGSEALTLALDNDSDIFVKTKAGEIIGAEKDKPLAVINVTAYAGSKDVTFDEHSHITLGTVTGAMTAQFVFNSDPEPDSNSDKPLAQLQIIGINTSSADSKGSVEIVWKNSKAADAFVYATKKFTYNVITSNSDYDLILSKTVVNTDGKNEGDILSTITVQKKLPDGSIENLEAPDGYIKVQVNGSDWTINDDTQKWPAIKLEQFQVTNAEGEVTGIQDVEVEIVSTDSSLGNLIWDTETIEAVHNGAKGEKGDPGIGVSPYVLSLSNDNEIIARTTTGEYLGTSTITDSAGTDYTVYATTSFVRKQGAATLTEGIVYVRPSNGIKLKIGNSFVPFKGDDGKTYDTLGLRNNNQAIQIIELPANFASGSINFEWYAQDGKTILDETTFSLKAIHSEVDYSLICSRTLVNIDGSDNQVSFSVKKTDINGETQITSPTDDIKIFLDSSEENSWTNKNINATTLVTLKVKGEVWDQETIEIVQNGLPGGEGPAGASYTNVIIKSTSQTFKKAISNNITPDSVTLTPQLYGDLNVAGQEVYWYKDTTPITDPSSSANIYLSGNNLIVKSSAFGTATSLNFKVEAYTGDNKTGTMYDDEYSLYLLSDGANGDPAYSAFLTDPSISFSADANGEIITDTTKTSTFKVFKGLEERTVTITEVKNWGDQWTENTSSSRWYKIIGAQIELCAKVGSNLGSDESCDGTVELTATADGKTFNLNLSWDKTNTGKKGDDGANIEYVYYRSQTEQTNLTAPSYDDSGNLSEGWNPSPQGITLVYKYEYVSIRIKAVGQEQWGDFSNPVIWARWGDKGTNGDGVEYKYCLTNLPVNQKPDYPAPTGAAYEWKDDPQGVSASNKYEYVVIIKTTYDNNNDATITSSVTLWNQFVQDGVSFSGVVEYYKAGTSATSAPGGVGANNVPNNTWKTAIADVGHGETNKYLWNIEGIKSTDASGNETIKYTAPDMIQVWNGRTVDTITSYYQTSTGTTVPGGAPSLSNNGNTLNVGSWPTSISTTPDEATYLWEATVTKYKSADANGHNTYEIIPAHIIGYNGRNGTDGKGVTIKGVAYVNATITDNNINSKFNLYSDEAFKTQITNPADDDAYLAQGYLFVYSGSNNQFTCVGKIQGPKGSDGNGVSNVVNYYMASSRSSGVSAGASGEQTDEQWDTSPQTTTKEKPFLWNYEVVFYTDMDSKSTEPTIIGYYTEDGKGIKAIHEIYCISASNTMTKPTSFPDALDIPSTGAVAGTWYKTSPVTTPTLKYLWNCEKIEYTDGTADILDPALMGTHGEQGSDGYTPIKGVDYFDGTDGADGTSIVWKGEYSSAPANPNNGWAYYNQTAKASYVYQNGTWYQMSIDGIDGQNGSNGTSIIWKGESSSAPSNPELNWVYKDTDDKKVYIYNGTGWELMVLDGSDGADGADGTDGLSVFITYNHNTDEPNKPTGSGNENGWSTIASADAIWMSQKIAASASEGAWGDPIKIKGDKGDQGIQGPQGPKGDKGDQGTGVSVKEGELACVAIGDGYIDADGNLMILTSLSPREFTNGGQIKGPKGDTTYFHTAYANSADGEVGFSVTDYVDKEFIGHYTDTVEADSTNPSDYKWSKMKGDKGEKGDQGIQGIQGEQGSSGDSIYVYSQSAYMIRNVSSVPTKPSGTPVTNGSSANTWYLTPIKTNDTYQYGFVVSRSMTKTNNGDPVPGEWETPILYSRYGVDGKNGSDATVTTLNTFNALTNGGQDQGIYFKDSSGNDWFPSTTTPNLPSGGKLYINASMIKTGIFEVADGKNTVFSAAVGGTDVTIGKFNVTAGATSGAISSGKNSLTSTEAGVYLGTDGIAVGDADGNGFKVDKNGDAIFKGLIEANGGKIGNLTLKDGAIISGAKINETSPAYNGTGLYLSDWIFSLGTNFTVTNGGALNAQWGTIGGWYLGNNRLASGGQTVTFSGTDNNIVLDPDNGIRLGNTFKVTKAGKLTATSGDIGGWELNKNGFGGSGFTMRSTPDSNDFVFTTSMVAHTGTAEWGDFASTDFEGILTLPGGQIYKYFSSNQWLANLKLTVRDSDTLAILVNNVDIIDKLNYIDEEGDNITWDDQDLDFITNLDSNLTYDVTIVATFNYTIADFGIKKDGTIVSKTIDALVRRIEALEKKAGIIK